MYAFPWSTRAATGTLTLHYNRHLVSTACLILPRATTPIQRQLHGVLRLFCVRIALYNLLLMDRTPKVYQAKPSYGFHQL